MRRSKRVLNGADGVKSKDGVSRQLRSKEAAKMDESLFNYEESPFLVDPEEQIKIVRNSQQLQQQTKPTSQDEAIGSSFSFNVDFNFKTNIQTTQLKTPSKRSLRNQTTVKRIQNTNHRLLDPLDMVVYANYHRKMEKEEKRMANRDREKIHAEADRMRAQLETLAQSDDTWSKLLPTITYIRDVKDTAEMLQKRQWTIDSLKLLLSKYDDWKRREDRLVGPSRARSTSSTSSTAGLHHQYDLTLYSKLNKYDYIGDSDTDEEEDMLTVDQINLRRRHMRSSQFGPVIKIRFGDNVVVAEPFKSTRIEKTHT